jgi:hypothetical protein
MPRKTHASIANQLRFHPRILTKTLIEDHVSALGAGIDNHVCRIERTFEVRGMVEHVTSYDNATVGQGNVVNDMLYAYDTLGRLVTVFDSAVNYTYGASGSAADCLNRLDAIGDTFGSDTGTSSPLAQYTYLGLDRIVQENYVQPGVTLDYFGGVSGTYAGFDSFGRVVQQLWANSAGPLDQFQYGYDRAGNRLWRRNVLSSSLNPPVPLDESYSYDGDYRLTDSQCGALNPQQTGISGVPVFKERFALDATGNFPAYVPNVSGSPVLSQARTHNSANELLSIANASV